MTQPVSGVRCQVSGESQTGRRARLLGSSSPTPDTRHPTPRRGVTLIELLVVMLIISILAALVLGVAAIAAETAKEAGTRHTVQRLHQLLTEYYGTFKTRRVRLRPDIGNQLGIESQIKKQFANDPQGGIHQGQALAEARLYALREMMLMEVPDRWSDVILVPIEQFVPNTPVPPLYLEGRTELSNVYYRRFVQLFNGTNTLTGKSNTAEELRANQGAECLYMVITTACGDGEARTLFGEHSIADTDGDGAPEFVDGWGHPVEFLRWAPGFDSQIQVNANALGNRLPNTNNTDWARAATGDHDSFDIFRTDLYAYRLVPLIMSGGRDESIGIDMAPAYVPWRLKQSQTITLSNSGPPYIQNYPLLPYAPYDSNPHYLGASLHVEDNSIDETSSDNIHNHLLGLR
ncbi:MAG: type II secretion system protein [Pirellulales bacterium]